MANAAHPEAMTVDEFLVYGAEVKHSELVRGRVRVYDPASPMHASIGGALFLPLALFVEQHGLGVVFMDNTGFELPNLRDTVRAPDVSFISTDRVPVAGFGRGFGRFAPDLAVEILSPDQSAWEMNEKLEDYLIAGTRLVWIIDPMNRSVAVHPHDGPVRWLHEDDVLDGGGVLPGFTTPIAPLFRRVARDLR